MKKLFLGLLIISGLMIEQVYGMETEASHASESVMTENSAAKNTISDEEKKEFSKIITAMRPDRLALHYNSQVKDIIGVDGKKTLTQDARKKLDSLKKEIKKAAAPKTSFVSKLSNSFKNMSFPKILPSKKPKQRNNPDEEGIETTPVTDFKETTAQSNTEEVVHTQPASVKTPWHGNIHLKIAKWAKNLFKGKPKPAVLPEPNESGYVDVTKTGDGTTDTVTTENNTPVQALAKAVPPQTNLIQARAGLRKTPTAGLQRSQSVTNLSVINQKDTSAHDFVQNRIRKPKSEQTLNAQKPSIAPKPTGLTVGSAPATTRPASQSDAQPATTQAQVVEEQPIDLNLTAQQPETTAQNNVQPATQSDNISTEPVLDTQAPAPARVSEKRGRVTF